MVSLGRAVDKGLDHWYNSRDDRFDSGFGWMQAVRQLERSIVHKRVVESWVELHIVLG